MIEGLFTKERNNFHLKLINDQTLNWSHLNAKDARRSGTKIAPSNADGSQNFSIHVASRMLTMVEQSVHKQARVIDSKIAGQTIGNQFEMACESFLEATFKKLNHLRPGLWTVRQVSSRKENEIASYEQYSHLNELARIANNNPELKAFLGEGYTIAPDVVVTRKPETDERINESDGPVVDDNSCRASGLRMSNLKDIYTEILHASISCKFTMRSDRAQNTRTEALNLLRSRKGRAPHIVSITAEPTPSRIASLAMGTGDLDCVYHFALYELMKSVEMLDKSDSYDLLKNMVDGKRLKDISDLPLDLAM
ncbi:NgoMIV family type II restriction endonuclease [Aliiglaciecola sp. CAU 1673]|uniref:NgoMIV family type II restriction endonuclease n=1 Tax=Aliiglaciecola sp. CAU 1673 TaxID=3032595 RepID=UPI0023DA7092|nr:NgoMIV family type II restriction endonuclease [Aliiglaciecola sp. CAU 1673]MDF2179097.1 NgoMIV family type II restriction endonuclease [Aliiglaciecola sp. CAU 1673]